MNLPQIGPLQANQSTYICNTRALLDLDLANQNGTGYYFSHFVAFQLPPWVNPGFFIDLSGQGVISDSPNTIFPSAIMYYLENIVRQNLGTDKVAELAFYKMLNKMGMSYSAIQQSIVFMNKVATANFITIPNNTGWGEIVGIVPNQSGILVPAWANNPIVPNIVPNDPQNDNSGLFDTGNNEFTFTDSLSKNTFDFANASYDYSTVNESFNFNLLAFFYIDSAGYPKLHGLNFISPWQNNITNWTMPEYTQMNNNATSIGFQFKLNVKTCSNNASQILVQDYNADGSHWNTYLASLTAFNSFLELQTRGTTPIG
jgi:hypothetical protein